MVFQIAKFIEIKYFIINVFLAIIVPQNLLYASEINREIKIYQIEVEGSTAFSSETIEALVSPYINKKVNFEQLLRLTQIITDLYVDRGYTTSGAFLPKQDISDGVVKIQVVEGRLENIEIEGLKHLKKSYISSGLRQVTRMPLNVNELQQALEKLKREPLIEQVEAELVQGTSRGSSVLILGIQEARIIDGRLIVDNHNSPSIGEIQGIVFLSHKNLLGIRDRAEFQYNLTEGFSNYDINYKITLNFEGTAIGFGYRKGESQIIEEPFNEVDIRAEADTFSLDFILPIISSQTTESNISFSFDRALSKTFIFGDKPFSFADGTDNGRSQLSVFRLKGDFLKRSNNSVLSVRSQLSWGVDLFDATVNENAPDGLFLSWVGQLQFAIALDKDQDIVWITSITTQLANDSLLPFEKITLGGVSTVRGYRQNSFVGDNGVVASLGLGIDWQIRDFLGVRLDLAIPLIDVEQRGDSLSDNGISFSVEFSPL